MVEIVDFALQSHRSLFALLSETFDKARKGYFLEAEWRKWAADKEAPRNADAAFIAFARKYAQEHPTAPGRGFASPKPPAPRRGRPRPRSRLLRHEPDGCGKICVIPIASRASACTLRPDLPPVTRPSGRCSPIRVRPCVVGDCSFLSRISGPGTGTKQHGNCQGPEAGPSADFDHGPRGERQTVVACRRQRSPGQACGRTACNRNRTGFPPSSRGGNDLPRLGKGRKWRCGGGAIADARRLGRLP
jgi:hypothetical protein